MSWSNIYEKKYSVESVSVSVSGGRFMMGALSTDEEAMEMEEPRHEVIISKNMVVMKYAVTQPLYKSVIGDNPSRWMGPDRPVEEVSWYDAVKFANALSLKCGLSEAYWIDGEDVVCDWSSNGWRLPTEAEWEYLARGGEEHLYAGSDDIETVANPQGDDPLVVLTGCTDSVGLRAANGFGLYDMSGNVSEWCWDYMQLDDNDFPTGESLYSSDAVTDPRGPSSGSFRVVRGGSWKLPRDESRISYRDWAQPSSSNDDCGFRLLRILI